MEETVVVQRGNTLEAKFTVKNDNTPYSIKTSKDHVIKRGASFSVRVIAAKTTNMAYAITYNNFIFVKFNKLKPEEDLTYTIRLSSTEFAITNIRIFVSDDGTWHLIHELKNQQFTFDLTVQMDIVPISSFFCSLHSVTDLTDFELRGEDGSVQMHRAVLAAASPVLRRMLSGTWRETTEGHVDLPGTSKLTLQHKDYVYLRTLPGAGIDQLLRLAAYYMMPVLEQKCVDILVNSLNANNASDLLEFATKHKLTELLLAILECFQNGAVKVSKMRDHLCGED